MRGAGHNGESDGPEQGKWNEHWAHVTAWEVVLGLRSSLLWTKRCRQSDVTSDSSL